MELCLCLGFSPGNTSEFLCSSLSEIYYLLHCFQVNNFRYSYILKCLENRKVFFFLRLMCMLDGFLVVVESIKVLYASIIIDMYFWFLYLLIICLGTTHYSCLCISEHPSDQPLGYPEVMSPVSVKRDHDSSKYMFVISTRNFCQRGI